LWGTAHLGSAPRAAAQSPAGERRAQPWKAPYQGRDASGPHVLGYWRFEPGEVEADQGPLKLPGNLRGGVATSAGKFGGGLESFAGWPHADEPHAFVVNAHSQLAPSAGFTLELWLQPKPELAKASVAYLADKKYASHTGYQWLLSAPDPGGARRMLVNLGFGDDSESFSTEPIALPAGVWQHLAFSYDGAGTVRFFRNGSLLAAVSRPGRQGVAAGPLGLSIADRLGSHYGGIPAVIDEVRVCRGALDFSPATVQVVSERLAWLRGESAPSLQVTVVNQQPQPLTDARLTVTPPGGMAKTISLPAIAAGESHTESVAWDTWLRPDDYRVRAQLEVPGDPPTQIEGSLTLQLRPRPLPHRMPVVMWGIGSPDEFAREFPRLKQLGFTHCLGFGADYGSIWQAKKPLPASSPTNIEATKRMLDTALAADRRVTPSGKLSEVAAGAAASRSGRSTVPA
jgi:hypothetical protein